MIPEFFQVVMKPRLWLQYMDDDIPKVNKDPLATVLAFNAGGTPSPGERLVLHVSRKRGQLAAGLRRCNNDAIENWSDVSDIEYLDVPGLDVFECGDDDFLQLANVFQTDFLSEGRIIRGRPQDLE